MLSHEKEKLTIAHIYIFKSFIFILFFRDNSFKNILLKGLFCYILYSGGLDIQYSIIFIELLSNMITNQLKCPIKI